MRGFRPEKLEKPRDFDERALRSFVAAGRPLDLEIGCGAGWHPIQYAKAQPGRSLVAIERTRDKFLRFQGRVARHALPNLFPVHADAVPFLVHAFPERAGIFERVFLLYPNPSPKNAAERWVRMPFFGWLVDRVKGGGEILIATNSSDYAEELREHAPEWDLRVERVSIVSPAGPFRTHFEKKYLERGERCVEIALRKPFSAER